MAPLESLFSRRGRTPVDVLLGLLTAQVFWVYMAYSQRYAPTLGSYVESRLESPPSCVAVLTAPRGALATILVGYSDRPILESYTLSPAGRLVLRTVTRTGFPAAMIRPADINGDGIDEIILLSASGTECSVLRQKGKEYHEDQYRLEFRAQRLTVADIDNDGIKDILVYGRSMAGVQTLTGTRRGTFEMGPLLFPEASVSDLVAVDLNGDRITDIVFLHWLSENLQVQFGIGREVFSEQVSLRLPGEPGRLALVTVSQRRTIRVAVTLPQNEAIAHIIGTPSGEFSIRELIPVQGHPLAIGLPLLNDDALPDLLCSTSEGLFVALGASTSRFAQGSMFGAGAGSVSWSCTDLDGNGSRDLALVDRAGRKLVAVANAGGTATIVWPSEYVTGIAPSGMHIADWNDDGRPDILVANRGSSTVGLFVGSGTGTFSGMHAFTVPEKPDAVRMVQTNAQNGKVFVTVHPTTEQLGIVRVPVSSSTVGVVAVPTGPRPLLIAADPDPETGRLSILLRYRDANGVRPPLSLFEEISSRQVVERSYQFTSPALITAMAVGDFTGNNKNDLVLAVRDRSSRQTSISLAPAFSGYDFRRIQKLFVVPDSTATVRLLTTAYLGSDGRMDVLLFLGGPRYAMGIAAAGSDSALLTLPPRWIPGVRPAGEQAVLCEDVDGDGMKDVVYLDEEVDAVYCLYGTGDRNLLAPRLVLRGEQATQFAVARVRGRKSADLILSHESRHTISLYSGVFDR